MEKCEEVYDKDKIKNDLQDKQNRSTVHQAC